MADQETDDGAETPGAPEANHSTDGEQLPDPNAEGSAEDGAGAQAGRETLRDRLGKIKFRKSVRAGLDAALKKEAGKSRGPRVKTADIPDFVAGVTDEEIDREARNAIAAEAQAVPVDPAAEGGGAEAKGPIRDWFQENRDLVKLVVDRLLKLILGA